MHFIRFETSMEGQGELGKIVCPPKFELCSVPPRPWPLRVDDVVFVGGGALHNSQRASAPWLL